MTDSTTSSGLSSWSDGGDSWSSASGFGHDAQPIEPLCRVLHPSLGRMREPTFDFNTVNPEQEKLPEDLPEAIAALAERLALSMRDTKDLQKVPLPVDVEPKIAMAAVSLAMYLAGTGVPRSAGSASRPASSMRGRGRRAQTPTPVTRQQADTIVFIAGPDNTHTRGKALNFLEAWRVFRDRARQVHHSEDWLIRHTSPASFELLKAASNHLTGRLERMALGASTLFHAVVMKDRYQKAQVQVLHCLSSQSLHAAFGRVDHIQLAFSPSPPLEAALTCCKESQGRVGLLTPTSGFKVGGTFLSGRQRGLEEEVCMRSTLFPLLLRGDSPAGKVGEVSVPEDGCMLASDVSVFRKDAPSGYAFMQEAVVMSILCISLPNLAPRYASHSTEVRGAPHGPLSKTEYMNMMRPKIECALSLAERDNLEVLVVSDDGLFELNNNPELYGRVISLVLATLLDLKLPKIVVTGSAKFRGMVRQSLNNIKRDPTGCLR